MRSSARAAYAALVVAGSFVALRASPVLAQRAHPVVGRAGSPPPSPSPLTTPYPGATVVVDPRWYGVQSPLRRPSSPHRHGTYGMYGAVPGSAYYYSGPAYAPYYPPYGGVNDVNGRPLATYFDGASNVGSPPMGDPDLRGSPYVVLDGGAMAIDFGNGDRRTVPACAAIAAMQTPEGQPRTVFYTPPADGVVLRAGSRGRVLGAPAAGSRVCYSADQYGRMVLDY